MKNGYAPLGNVLARFMVTVLVEGELPLTVAGEKELVTPEGR
jgi:hypothetical protein